METFYCGKADIDFEEDKPLYMNGLSRYAKFAADAPVDLPLPQLGHIYCYAASLKEGTEIAVRVLSALEGQENVVHQSIGNSHYIFKHFGTKVSLCYVFDREIFQAKKIKKKGTKRKKYMDAVIEWDSATRSLDTLRTMARLLP